MVACWAVSSKICRFKHPPEQKFDLRFRFRLHPLANSASMGTPTVHCQWEDQAARERSDSPSSYAETKKTEVANVSYS